MVLNSLGILSTHLSSNHSDFRNCSFGIGIDKFGTVPDDSTIFLTCT